jgi:ABC-type transport system substrate-binding protein
VVLACVATACSGGSSGTAEPPAPDDAGFAALAVPQPVGGTLRLGVTAVTSLDPALVTGASPSQNLVADLLFDGLTAYDPVAKQVTGALARSWAVSGDGLVWTFRLDPGATFSDGRPVTAADVKASLERVMALGVKSVSGLRLAGVQGYADVVNGTATTVGGLVVREPTVLEIHLTAPFSTLPELLADPAFGIVPMNEPTDAGAFAAQPIGSGPFALDHRGDASLSLVRAPGKRTELDRVELHLYADTAAAYAAFVAGEVDQSLLPPDSVAAAQQAGAQVAVSPQQVSMFYGMNVASPALSSVPLRQAILKAVDRDTIRATFFGAGATTMTGVVGPTAAGRRDNGCGTACAYDPAAATALVQAAFPAGGVPTVHVDHYTDPAGREAGVAAAIVGYLQAVGIPAEARAHTFDEYQTVPTGGSAELFRFGWIGSYPSADAYLGSLFASTGADNVFSVADATLDTEITDARASLDAATRITHESAAEDRVFALAVVLPIAQYTVAMVASPKVQDLVLAPSGSFDATKVWLDS